jgi:hypothetical protein
MPSARMLALAALIPFALATPVARQASAQTWQIHPNGDSTRVSDTALSHDVH